MRNTNRHFIDRGILPECMLNALGGYDLSAIEFYCSKKEAKQAMERFEKSFTYRWRRELPKVIRDFNCSWDAETKEYMYEDNPVPIKTVLTEDGFRADLGEMSIQVGEDNGTPDWMPLLGALDTFRKEFPKIRYRGYVGFFYSDHLGGQPEQYEFFSDALTHDRFYESIKRGLQKAVMDDFFWECLMYGCGDEVADAVLSVLKDYEQWLDPRYKKRALKMFKKMAKEVEGCELPESIREYLSGSKRKVKDSENDIAPEPIDLKEGYYCMPSEFASLFYGVEQMKHYWEIHYCIEAGEHPEALVREWALEGDKESIKLIKLLDKFEGKVVWNKNGDLIVHSEFFKGWSPYQEDKGKSQPKKRGKK